MKQRAHNRRSLAPSALENASYASADINSRVAESLTLVDLTGFDNRRVTDLSGGEQQRVALARALAPRPRLLMFDEPLGALDRTLKEDLLNELRGILHKTKIPAIYVTHDQEEAFAIADRVLLLHDGKIIREGAPAEVWSHPGSAWAAKFLGAGNVVEGIVAARGKVKTEFGALNVQCGHEHQVGARVSLLLKQLPSPFRRPSKEGRWAGGEVGEEIKLKVEDVLFKWDQFEVRARGGFVIHQKEKPTIGQVVRARVKAECLG
jgi:ABC-type Fe3+/spermidine/putrescine transport system ATPase subunit